MVLSLSKLLFFSLVAFSACAQTTMGVIGGRVVNELDGHGILASVTATARNTRLTYDASSDAATGSYAFAALPPGIYDLAVSAGSEYRPAMVKGVELAVAGYVEQNVSLRLLSDVWQKGVPRSSISRDYRTVLLFYGPDVDTSRFEIIEASPPLRGNLTPSISEVVDQQFLDRLPLAGRDVYELIGLQPGAASDLATVRGVGVSVNGQRPSASSFLLNGLENNNYLTTGPLTPLPPEAIEEYRVSTNNFAAEFGRTSGYLSNAVTRRGTSEWHGLGYFYTRQDWLNATDVQQQQAGQAKQPFSEYEAGVRLTGPLRQGLYNSTLFEGLTSQAWASPQSYTLPTWSYIDALNKNTDAWQLLNRFRPGTPGGPGQVQTVDLSRPSTLNRIIGLERVDWEPAARRHVGGAIAVTRETAPDFFWSPYPDFVSAQNRNALAASATYTESLSPALTLEVRGGYGRDVLDWDNNYPDVPRLAVQAGRVTLPGSPQAYLLTNRGNAWELSANMMLVRGRHNWKWGGGFLLRSLSGGITTPDGKTKYTFANLNDYGIDQPVAVQYGAARQAAIDQQYTDPALQREYRYAQFYGFVQDSFRATGRLLLHYGARYDYFGPPRNVGPDKDTLIELGTGGDIVTNLGNAQFLPLPSGSQQLYAADHNDAAARVGFALNLRADGSTILRGSYGLYYDRPFDNLWLNLRFNDAVPALTLLGVPDVKYLSTPLSEIVAGREILPSLQRYPLGLYQPGIRTPYVNSVFFGLQRRISESFLAEIDYAGSFGRKLISTDLVNRQRTLCNVPGAVCRPDPEIDNDMDYRANQGSSRYEALVSSLRIRYRFGEARVSYTYSHAIDNQSDPLTGLLSSNLEVTNISAAPIEIRPAGFTRQFDSSVDMGSANFDQRQSFVFYSYIDIPSPASAWGRRLLGGWTCAQLGAIRSGTPYTIYANSTSVPFLWNRGDLISPQTLANGTGSYDAGERLLNPASFAEPQPGTLGTSGRNAYGGPVFYNLDLSLSRSFAVPRLGERFRLLLRADAYNVLNHANLSNPEGARTFVGDPNFAVASYGRQATPNGLLAITPLAESGRQIQLMLRLSF